MVGVWAVVQAVLLSTTVLEAQEPSRGRAVRLGAGVGIASTEVGGRTGMDQGLIASAQFAMLRGRRTDYALEVNGQFFKAENPLIDEAYTAFYVLAGPDIRLGSSRKGFLRPSVGLVHRSWSGTQVVSETETSLALGVAAGFLARLAAGPAFGPELYLRVSGAEELSTRLIGLQLTIQPWGR